jgi:hypothetical protein
MKYLATLVMILVFPLTVWASPILVCDPSADVISQIEVETTYAGVTTITAGAYTVVSGYVQLLDVAGFPNGAYTFRDRWSDASGWWSDWSVPLNAVKAGKPGNFKIK